MKLRIAGKLIAAMGVTLTIALTAGFWVVLSREDRQAKADFGQELATITGYARSVQEFLSENLPSVGTDSTYHDLNTVPVIAAWRTARRYARQKAYTFSTPSLTPRSLRNQPNAFERRALEAFQNHPELQEYAEEVFREGQWMYQYAVPMRLTEDCLPCHGTPKGKSDPFGYPREGLKVGDLRGAFSVAAPLAPLMARQRSNRRALFWVGLCVVLVTGAAIFVAVRIVTHPLDTFLGAIRRMGEGKIGERVEIHSEDEVGELTREFNRMVDRLETSYATLEERVQERTRALEHSQSQLVQASKLAALGELVGGIAHEVNNPIGIIVMRLASLKSEAEREGLSEDLLDDLEVIQRQSDKIAQITSGLLAFSRQTPFSPQRVDLNKTVSNAAGLVENVLRNRGIVYRSELAEGLPSVSLDTTRIEQVLLNLFNNAMDAMPAGGDLIVTTGLDTDDAGRQWVHIQVKDTGEGIREEHLDRLFDPFFTTKDVGKGTGLGLSISYGLIQEHGGNISVDSMWGEETTFRIDLPAFTAEGKDTEG